MKKIYTGGTFDLFHSGHVNFLRECKEIAGAGGKVIVALNTDEFVLDYKGALPVCTEQERKIVLDACEYVDQVVCNTSGADSKPTILSVKPNYIAIGSDWAMKDYHKQMGFNQQWLDEYDIGLIYIPYTRFISTSDIKKRMQ